ncbi:MAG: PorT family protein, partial [Prevotella sp.]|nr:PorT family protein [Prevotella sp.]
MKKYSVVKTIVIKGCLCLAAIIAYLPLSAQTDGKRSLSIGLSCGLTHNSLTTSTGYRSFTQYGDRNGLSIGIPVKYSISDWLAVQAEPGYIGKGYRYFRTGLYENVFNLRLMNSFVHLPLMAQFSFGGERLRGFVNFGGFGGYWLKSFTEGQIMEWTTSPEPEKPIYDFSENVAFDKRRDNRIEAGVLTGTGIQWDFLPRYTAFVEARYYYSLTDLQKSYMLEQVPRYNNT